MKSEDEVEATQSVEPPPPAESAPVAVKPKSKALAREDAPLFIGEDIDDLLGMPKEAKRPSSENLGPKPVHGMDALSLDDEKSGSLVITPHRMTLVIVALALLLMLTFAAGMFLGMNASRGG